MHERHTFFGRHVALDLVETTPQRFRWMMLIDGGAFHTSRCFASTEELARCDALLVAQLLIAKIERDCSSAKLPA